MHTCIPYVAVLQFYGYWFVKPFNNYYIVTLVWWSHYPQSSNKETDKLVYCHNHVYYYYNIMADHMFIYMLALIK